MHFTHSTSLTKDNMRLKLENLKHVNQISSVKNR